MFYYDKKLISGFFKDKEKWGLFEDTWIASEKYRDIYSGAECAKDQVLEKKLSEWLLLKNIRRCILFRLLPTTFICMIIVGKLGYDIQYFKYIFNSLFIVWTANFVVGFIATIKTHFLIISKGKKYKEERRKQAEEDRKQAYERSITCQYCGTKPFKEENIQYQLIRSYDYTEIKYDYIGDRKTISDRIPYLIEEYVIIVKRQCCGTEYEKDGRLEINKRDGYKRWR